MSPPSRQGGISGQRDSAFPATRACARVRRHVDLPVSAEAEPLPKPLAALGALVRLLLRVRPLVAAAVRAEGEGLPALGAHVWLLAGVDAPVRGQPRSVEETLPAVQAPVSLPSLAHPTVLRGGGAVCKAFSVSAVQVLLLANRGSLLDGKSSEVHVAFSGRKRPTCPLFRVGFLLGFRFVLTLRNIGLPMAPVFRAGCRCPAWLCFS